MDVQVQSAVTGAAKQVASERRRVMSQKLAVVVTGATGKQGGAVVKSLLERGHEVRAVTRSTDSAKARELANTGVTLVRASLEDTAELTKALEGATSLFAMTTPFEGGTQAETRQGISAADAAKAAGVHLVFTTIGSTNRQTGIPHFESKYEVSGAGGHLGSATVRELKARLGANANIVALSRRRSRRADSEGGCDEPAVCPAHDRQARDGPEVPRAVLRESRGGDVGGRPCPLACGVHPRCSPNSLSQSQSPVSARGGASAGLGRQISHADQVVGR